LQHLERPVADDTQAPPQTDEDRLKKLQGLPPIGQAMAVPGAQPNAAPPQPPKAMPMAANAPASAAAAPAMAVQAAPAFQLPTPKQPLSTELWQKASEVQNPFKRVLAQIGAGAGKALDIAGSALVPGIAMNVPGSTLNTNLANRAADRRAMEVPELNARVGLENAQAGEAVARGEAAKNPGAAETAKSDAEMKQREKAAETLGIQPGTPEYQRYVATGQIAPPPAPKTPSEQVYASDIAAGKTPQEALADSTAAKPDTANQDRERYENIIAAQGQGRPVKPADAAWAKAYAKAGTLGPAATATFNAPQREDARLDKSYQYSNTAMDKLSAPIDQLNQRLGRLNDTLAQGNMQSDALVAPELLSVMSGGAGSGLRMNEAEISRIVGGRTNWESLKAAMQKWNTDPSSARSITAEQDKQIKALVKTVQDKIIAKEKVLDESRSALIDATDVADHRRILADTKTKLDKIDAGEAGGGGHSFSIGDKRYENVPDELYQKAKTKPGFKE
jgi:hypothetical protein